MLHVCVIAMRALPRLSGFVSLSAVDMPRIAYCAAALQILQTYTSSALKAVWVALGYGRPMAWVGCHARFRFASHAVCNSSVCNTCPCNGCIVGRPCWWHVWSHRVLNLGDVFAERMITGRVTSCFAMRTTPTRGCTSPSFMRQNWVCCYAPLRASVLLFCAAI